MLVGFNDPLDVCLWVDHLDNGVYEVTSYALTPNDPGLLSRVRVDFATEGPVFVGGDWNGAHQNGVTYTRHYVEVTDNEIGFHSGLFGGDTQSGLNGFQIRLISPSSAPEPELGSLAPRIETISPNPAFASQTIGFSLPQPSSDMHLEILTPTGRVLWRRALSGLAAGSHAVQWDGRDDRGRLLPASVYFVKLTATTGVVTRPIIRIR